MASGLNKALLLGLIPGLYLALGTLLVVLPTLHPWYLLLIIPFMVFFPSRPWLFLSAAMVLTFPVLAVEHNTGVFQEIYAVKPLIYLPFAALLLQADGYRFAGEAAGQLGHPSVNRLGGVFDLALFGGGVGGQQ